MKFSLPIYWESKKGKVDLVGMNKFRNYHYFVQNKMKKEFEKLVVVKTTPHYKEIQGNFEMKYTLYYKTGGCDLMNIVSMIDKFTMDALQSVGIIQNDNVKNYRKMSAEVGGVDKDNPRIEIEIKEIA